MAELDGLSELLLRFLSADNGAGTESEADNNQNGGIFGDIDPETLIKLLDVFSALNSSDKNTELLMALKPHLRAENQSKLEQAAMLMKLFTIIPLLNENGGNDKTF